MSKIEIIYTDEIREPLVVKIKLKDTCPESPTVGKEIPCTVQISPSRVVVQVDGYEDNAAVNFEYWDSKLQAQIWGEESLQTGGDCDIVHVLTNDVDKFMQAADRLYQE